MMVNEGQHMRALSKQVQQFGANDDAAIVSGTEKSLQLAKQAKQKPIRPRISAAQIRLMQSVSKTYDSISSKIKPQSQQMKRVQSFSTKTTKGQGGCAPCSRKRK
jgi:hypothetical protein